MPLKRAYGVATIGKLLKIIGLFCRISSLLQGSFTKETYPFKEPILLRSLLIVATPYLYLQRHIGLSKEPICIFFAAVRWCLASPPLFRV